MINDQDIYHRDDNQNEKKESPIYRICITGGPCSGKTTALAKLQNIYDKKGFRIFTVPEAATLLMKSGAMIDMNKLSPE